MNAWRSCLCLELNAQLKREMSAQVQREQEAPQDTELVMLDQSPPSEAAGLLLLVEWNNW